MKWLGNRYVRVGSALAILVAVLVGGLAYAAPPPNPGHYEREQGFGPILKPIWCQTAGVEFVFTDDEDSGWQFGWQRVVGIGTPYPEMYTYSNVAYFAQAQYQSYDCASMGPRTIGYTIRVQPGMQMAGTPYWDGTPTPSCTVVNTATEKGYNCTMTINPGAVGVIRTKFYVTPGTTLRWTWAQQMLWDQRGDWMQWQNWYYQQASGA